jgi:hypothetical protein
MSILWGEISKRKGGITMKRPRKPTRRQKIIISGRHLNPVNWFVARDLGDKLILRHRDKNTIREILKLVIIRSTEHQRLLKRKLLQHINLKVHI